MEHTGRPLRSSENARRGAASGGDKPRPYGIAHTLARFTPGQCRRGGSGPEGARRAEHRLESLAGKLRGNK